MTAVRDRLAVLDLAPVLAFATLTALAAQVTIPLWPVPFTLQTAAVLASGLFLGARRGAAAQAVVLAAGAAGLPVFAAMRSGLPWLVGPTGGYLTAFVLAAWLAGAAAERWQGWRLALAVSAAAALVLSLGALWLSRFVGPSAWTVGFSRFLPSEALKVMAVLTGFGAYKKR